MSGVTRLKLTLLLATAIVSACTTGNGDGLDINGRPITGNDGGPLVATFKSIQDNVLTPLCTSCHAGPAAPVGLRLDEANSYALMVGIAAVQVPGLLLVNPGDPDNSYLIQKMDGTAGVGARMPLGAPAVPTATIDVMRQWIIDGALPPDTPSDTPPTVVSVLPEPASIAAVLPAEIRVIFSQPMDASLLNPTTFVVIRAGNDSSFDDGNEVEIVADSISLAAANPALATFDLSSTPNVEDEYRITLLGTGATAVANLVGVILDGDGDGTAGGDFVSQFGVSAVLPTLESIQDNVFTPSCATVGCHTSPVGPGVPATMALNNAAVSYAALVNVPSTGEPTLLRVEPGNAADSFLFQKLHPDPSFGFQMPLGGQQLPWPTIDVIGEWINAGALYDGGPPDTMPPVVSLIVPASPLAGTVVLSANAVDDVAVASVEFFVDGVSIGSSVSAPFALAWDTTTVADGAYMLTARATDEGGNSGDSTPVNITVTNAPPDVMAPSVMLTAPVATDVGGLVTVAADAMDDTGVVAVRFYIDGQLLGTDMTAPYALDWDTTTFADGMYEIGADASDAAGNIGTAMSLTVTVDNIIDDTTPPDVTLTAPVATEVGGLVTVAADAMDDTGVVAVRFYIDGLLLGTDMTSPYALDWDTTVFADGMHEIGADASDAAGNVGTAMTLTVTVDNTTDDTIPPEVTLNDPGGIVGGTVTLTAEANDDIGVSEVRFYAGIDFIGADAFAPYATDWDTTTANDGTVTLTAEAADAAGNVGFSLPVDVFVDNTAPTVTSIDPADGATLEVLPAAITVTFSEQMGPNVDDTSVLLQAAGGDATFGDGNEVDIMPASVTLDGSATIATMDLTGVASMDDTYRLTIDAIAVEDVNGFKLDGNGDGTGGDDYTADFTVASPPPTYTNVIQPILEEKCDSCHTADGFGGHNIGSVYEDADDPAGTCPGENVAECSLTRIQNGTMPLNQIFQRPCSGDPAADVGIPECLTQEEQDLLQQWIDAGLPE